MSPIQLSEKLRSSMNGGSDPTMINHGINTVVLRSRVDLGLLYFLLSTSADTSSYVRLFRLAMARWRRRRRWLSALDTMAEMAAAAYSSYVVLRSS